MIIGFVVSMVDATTTARNIEIVQMWLKRTMLWVAGQRVGFELITDGLPLLGPWGRPLTLCTYTVYCSTYCRH